jgi:hypothetical protein
VPDRLSRPYLGINRGVMGTFFFCSLKVAESGTVSTCHRRLDGDSYINVLHKCSKSVPKVTEDNRPRAWTDILEANMAMHTAIHCSLLRSCDIGLAKELKCQHKYIFFAKHHWPKSKISFVHFGQFGP